MLAITLINVKETLDKIDIDLSKSDGMALFNEKLSEILIMDSWGYNIPDDILLINTEEYSNLYDLPDLSIFGEVVMDAY